MHEMCLAISVVVEGMLSEPNCEQESCQNSTILAESVERYTGAGVLFIRIRGKNNPVAPVVCLWNARPGWSLVGLVCRNARLP